MTLCRTMMPPRGWTQLSDHEIQQAKRWHYLLNIGREEMSLEGQDPTCIVVESALNIAVVRGHTAMNLIPPGVPHGASHYAVIHGSIRICQQLLQAKADPSLPDRSGCWPIRYALSGIATPASAQITEVLLCWGADAMQRDPDEDTGFSMAVPGSLTALCLARVGIAWLGLTCPNGTLRLLWSMGGRQHYAKASASHLTTYCEGEVGLHQWCCCDSDGF